jgi:drug/metabolite transporter (DMT)-like permease
VRLGALGLLLYGLTQATVFFGLARLPAVTVTLLLSLAPALVTVLAIPLLAEVPTPLQGGGVLLAVAVAHDGVPRLSLSSWLVVGWLAVVNTAVAFTVWNHTMRRLSAMESSLINNTMLVHVAVLAWIFLGERPGARGMLGLALGGRRCRPGPPPPGRQPAIDT